MCIRDRGEWEASVAALERALALNPLGDYGSQLGISHAYLRNFDEAIRTFERYLALHGDNAASYPWRFIVLSYLCWGGQVERAREVFQEMNDRYAPEVVAQTFEDPVFTGTRVLADEYWDVLQRLQFERWPSPRPSLYYQAMAQAYEMRSEPELAGVFWDSNRVELEASVVSEPNEAWGHMRLAMAYAGLGRSLEALQAAARAVELGPSVSEDAFDGPDWLWYQAEVSAKVGNANGAVEQLEYLLSIPSILTVGLLEVDPIYDSIRDDPGFQALLERHRN